MVRKIEVSHSVKAESKMTRASLEQNLFSISEERAYSKYILIVDYASLAANSLIFCR